MATKTPIVDGDMLVYRIGFAAGDSEPVEYALHSVKTVLTGIWDRYGSDGPVFLSGEGNYRNNVATIRPYKGNRAGADKPFYYHEIREYLITQHNAQIVNGMESDDACSILQWNDKDRRTIIVHQDKDINNTPGWHFNPVKQEEYYITLQQANQNFWMQVLTGDITDNIQGIPKVGPVTAAKILAGKEDWYAMHHAALHAYKEKGFTEQDFHENATLVWIQRDEWKNYDGSDIREYGNKENQEEGRNSENTTISSVPGVEHGEVLGVREERVTGDLQQVSSEVADAA